MHIHIPSFSEATDSKGSKFKVIRGSTWPCVIPETLFFQVFDIYVNGVYHGSARYSQLLELHNEVRVCPLNGSWSHV